MALNYTQESQYEEVMDANVTCLWQQRSDGYVKGQNNKALYWISLTSPEHSKAIVVVNGRVESVWKYQELFYDLFQQGFDIYSFDHRGQGISERVADDCQIGHVEQFDDYVDDMATVLSHFALSRYQQRFILAHSMGGAIASRYLQTYSSHGFHAVALCAPMFGIYMPAYLAPISKHIACIVTRLTNKPTHITSQKEYAEKAFEQNLLTSSAVRYKRFRRLYDKKPELQVAGPSSRWLLEGLMAADKCIKQADKVSIPLLLLQGSEDKVVCNKSHLRFITKLQKSNPNARMETMAGGKHELLFETDKIRNSALDKIVHFFKQAT